MEDRLFSIEESAKFLGGLSKYTIHAWLSSGKLRRTKVGSRTMIRESELLRVIEDGGKSQAPARASRQRCESRSFNAPRATTNGRAFGSDRDLKGEGQ